MPDGRHFLPTLHVRMAAVCLLLAVSAVTADAQRGGRSARGRSGAGASSGIVGDPSPTLKAADVERLNPVAMLLTRAKTLGITDAQVTRLQGIRDSLDARNASHLVVLDSVLAQVRLHATDTSGTEGDRLMRTGNDRSAFTATLGAIRDNDDGAAQEALGLFSGTQLSRAYNVIREQRTMMGAVVRGGGVPQFDAPNDRIEFHP